MSSLPPLTPPASDASALRSWLLAAKSAVERRGVDADALLREVGLDLSTLSDPMARYPAHLGLAFWQKALQATGEELLGVDLALQFMPLNFSALGYALMASDNLAQMYLRLARYAHVVTDAADVRFQLDDGAGRLTITGDQALLGTAEPATVWSIYDYAMLTLVRGSRMLYGRDFMPLELRLQRQRPKDHAKFEKVFRCTPVYGCEDNALVVDHVTLHKPLSFANLEVVKASEEAMDRYRSHWPDRGLPQQLAAVLKEMLPSGEPRQEDVTRRLGTTLRTLQRRLADQGTSYRDVLNQTRHQLALDYLTSARYSVGEISFLLGFSEVSAFTRAFKRWTGSSPSTWRQAAPTLPPHAH
ncbi:AraC family transcriptional regulator [Aquabacterium sp. CECT 9606]|uniref:AraC family transcriptional regulator n=1 Tax=Aquabacterium sp. CECT 9606 TaxID=2845822 RepID=UPI001E343E6A|nr:AraC family transcriptional regulator [Aquabacterium sp. CECT 9606]CAH0351438.1 HTH-type transcriptional regulator VirS [Aquabacterium sp. CECT 9606]